MMIDVEAATAAEAIATPKNPNSLTKIRVTAPESTYLQLTLRAYRLYTGNPSE